MEAASFFAWLRDSSGGKKDIADSPVPVGFGKEAGTGSCPNRYQDSNGNMTAMADKGITNISYNYLNLPVTVDQRGNQTQYAYRADGVKLKRSFTLNNAAGSNTTSTEYLGGFQYVPASITAITTGLKETDDTTQAVKTAGQEEIYTDSRLDANAVAPQPQLTMALSFFPTAEGFYDYQKKQYIYQYKDQVGNIRMSYAKNPDTGELDMLDRNDYYPFGMNFVQGSEFSVVGSPLNYKFGGKELQESGFYDFGARNYMPDLGRWFGADPLAELSSDLSPYRYAFNNPISFTDPDGMYEGDMEGDYYDDSDPEIVRQGFIDTGNCSCSSLKEDIENIGEWKIGFGGESGDGAYNDFGQDMMMEHGSNTMMDTLAERDPPPPVAGSEDGPRPKKTANLTPIAPQHINNYDGIAGKLLYLWDGGIPGNGGKYNMDGELIGIAPVMLTVPDVGKGAGLKIGKELFKFSARAAEHMAESGRAVPVQVLQQAINESKGVADPRGSRALMHTTEMWKNGKAYNLEVLYDKTTNSIWHFKYWPK